MITIYIKHFEYLLAELIEAAIIRDKKHITLFITLKSRFKLFK